MKKPQLKQIRIIANEMVERGAPVVQKVNNMNWPINHARRIKRLVTRAKLPLGKAIDTYVGKYFELKKVEAK